MKTTQTLPLFRDNFCSCEHSACKNGLMSEFRSLLKSELNQENISSIQSILVGSPGTDKIVNQITYLLQKIKHDEFSFREMDAMLDLFLVLYYKCSLAVRLNFVDDIDRNLFGLIKDVENKFLRGQEIEFFLNFYHLNQIKLCNTDERKCEMKDD